MSASAEVSITVFDNGPIEVKGPVQLLDENGRVIATEPGEPFYLCRCGQSSDRPYCDGSHFKCGFVHKMTQHGA